MQPINGEVPQIDWPVVTIGKQDLVVRWTFYATWLLSKRRVKLTDLSTLMAAKDPSIVDTTMECFAAAVAENFTTAGLPAPDADHWALAISKNGGPKKFGEINAALWEAVGKAPRETAPTPQPTEQPGMTQ